MKGKLALYQELIDGLVKVAPSLEAQRIEDGSWLQSRENKATWINVNKVDTKRADT